MRDVDRRDPEVGLQGGDVGPHLHAQLRVEVGERLVHQEHLRQPDDRAPHRHTLALAAGELARLAVQILLEAEQCRDLADARLTDGLLDPRHLERETDVGLDGEVRIERVVLEDHRDVPILRRRVGDVSVADVDRAGVDLLEAGEHPEGSRLAGAGRPDEHHELTVRDVELERVDGRCVGSGVDPRCVVVADFSHSTPPRVGRRSAAARVPRALRRVRPARGEPHRRPAAHPRR